MIKFRYVRKEKSNEASKTKVGPKSVMKRKKESTQEEIKSIKSKDDSYNDSYNNNHQIYERRDTCVRMPGVTNKEYQSCIKSIFVSYCLSHSLHFLFLVS